VIEDYLASMSSNTSTTKKGKKSPAELVSTTDIVMQDLGYNEEDTFLARSTVILMLLNIGELENHV
jgi:hypothetical protein